MQTRWIQVVSLVLAGVMFFAASRFIPSINAERKRLNMIGEASIEKSAPPEYAFAIQAFGAFRGILTNIAFIRAEQYKEEGRYYDAMQLAHWICQLQPRFPTVWAFQAWNMAWNISVTTHTPEERWNWVYSGVRLLRDEGIKYNPRAVNLYKELAWIFVNKMSENTDEYHLFYKRNWAWRMHLVLGSPPDPVGTYRPDDTFKPVDIRIGEDELAAAALKDARRRVDRLKKKVETRGKWYDIQAYQAAKDYLEQLEKEQQQDKDKQATPRRLTPSEVAKQAVYQKIKAIADAPDKLADLYAKYPQTKDMVRQLRSIGVVISDETIDEDEYTQENIGLADTFFYRYRLLTEPPALLGQLLKEREADPDEPNRKRLGEILGLDKQSEAGQALVRFLQKKVLHDVYKLKAARMAELTATFGPIDWRVVDAHSLYWVNEGLIASQDSIRDIRNDKTNTARLIFFSLRNLMQRNRMTFEPYTKNINYAYINFSPDLNFIEPMHEAYLTYGRMLDPEPEKKGAGATYRTGHINFLAEAIRLLYFANRIPEAMHYYNYLRDTYGYKNGKLEPRYAKPLRDYVFDTLRETGTTQNERRVQIYGLLMQAWEQLAQGNRAQANMLREAARFVLQQFNQQYIDERITKMRLPPFNDIQTDTLYTWYRQPAVSPFILLQKARLWAQLTLDYKLPLYDRLIDQLRQECDLYGFDVEVAFAPPPGLDAWRKTHPGRIVPKPKSDVETPAQNSG